jgi:hypothetical protein
MPHKRASPCPHSAHAHSSSSSTPRFIERRLAQAQILLSMVAPLAPEFRRPLMLLQPNLYVGFPAGKRAGAHSHQGQQDA